MSFPFRTMLSNVWPVGAIVTGDGANVSVAFVCRNGGCAGVVGPAAEGGAGVTGVATGGVRVGAPFGFGVADGACAGGVAAPVPPIADTPGVVLNRGIVSEPVYKPRIFAS